MSTVRAVSKMAASATVLTLVLTGCAGGPNGASNAGLVASSGGCKSLKRELRRYEARGIQYKADAANRGAKLTAKQRDAVRQYNNLLDTYLGNKCHV